MELLHADILGLSRWIVWKVGDGRGGGWYVMDGGSFLDVWRVRLDKIWNENDGRRDEEWLCPACLSPFVPMVSL